MVFSNLKHFDKETMYDVNAENIVGQLVDEGTIEGSLQETIKHTY